MNPGGKGANQAVAAARLGANVRFITKTGTDIFGQQAQEGFIKEGIDMAYLATTKEFASGVALITVNKNGENEIVVASGANMDLRAADLPDVVFENVTLVLIQLEIPMETVRYVLKKCKELGIKAVLNPAPAAKLDDEILDGLYLITPNETETQIITGTLPADENSRKKAAAYFLSKGVENVIITLGKAGVYLKNHESDQIIPSLPVQAVDSTAAGDVFNGALVTALSQDKNWVQACEYACQAAAISVTRLGAQSSAPYEHEL